MSRCCSDSDQLAVLYGGGHEITPFLLWSRAQFPLALMTFAVVILAAYLGGMGYVLIDRLLED